MQTRTPPYAPRGEREVPGLASNLAVTPKKAHESPREVPLQEEVQEVMAQLLASARDQRSQTTSSATTTKVQVKTPSPTKPYPELRRVLIEGRVDAREDHEEDLSEPSNLTSLAHLQARVEQRASQLKRDMASLAEQKRSLLIRGATRDLEREAEADLLSLKQDLSEKAKAARRDIQNALDATTAELQGILENIDDNLELLEQVTTAVHQQEAEIDSLRQRTLDSLVEWMADAKAAHQLSETERWNDDVRWIQQQAQTLLPDDPASSAS